MTGQWKEKVTLPPKRRTAGWSVPKTFYRELLWVAQDRGYKPGWAYFKYREKVGDFPPKEEYGRPVEASAYTRWFVETSRK